MEDTEHPPQLVAISDQSSTDSPTTEKIPVEILRIIFNQVVNSFERYMDPHTTYATLSLPYICATNSLSYGSYASPFSLSHVCRHWRRIALEFPDIWTNFRVIEPRPHLTHLVFCWLQRSGRKPLTFRLHQGRDTLSFSTMLGIFNLLLSHATRWKSVELDVDSRIELFIDNTTAPPPLALENINIILRKGSDLDRCPNLFTFLHSSPRLSTVTWDNTTVSIPLSELNWWKLTYLSLYVTQSVVRLLSALSQCEHLETLRIHRQNMRYNFHIDLPAICLPALRNLCVGSLPQQDVIFSCLTLPALTNLTFREGLEPTDLSNTWNTIHDLIVRSSCILKCLTIEKLNVKDEGIHVRNFKAPNFHSLDTLHLLFRRTSSEIRFNAYDGGTPHIIVRALKEEDRPHADIFVQKDPSSKIKPFDMGCAARCAFAFEAEHTSD